VSAFAAGTEGGYKGWMSRVPVLALVLVTAAAVLWVLVGADREGAPGRGGPDSHEVPDGVATDLFPGRDVVAADGLALPASAPDTVERARTAAGASGPTFEEWPDETLGFEVLVVTAAGEPVPGATIVWLDDDTLVDTEQARFQAEGFDVDRLFESYGRFFRADREGRCRLPREDSNPVLLGKGAGLSVIANLSFESEPFVLELAPDPVLVVRVVDDRGRPIPEVPVAMRFRFDESNRFDVTKVRTRSDGIAELSHARSVQRLLEEGALWVGIGAVLTAPVEAPVEDLATPIELVLPAHGALEVRLVHPDGEPARASALAKASWSAPGVEEQEGPIGVTLVEGVGRLFPVALGLEVSLEIESLQDSDLARTERFAGPRAPGEVVLREVEVELGTRLVARVLDPDGVPFRDRSVRVVRNLLTPEDWDRGARLLRTSTAGRLVYEVEQPAPPGARHWLELSVLDVAGHVGHVASVDLPAALRHGENDLGDLRASQPPLVVAGRVLDQDSRPVRGAEVDLFASTGSGENPDWEHLRDLEAFSDREGRFSIRGAVSQDHLRLQASHARYVAGEAADVRRGTRDALLAMRAAGSLSVSFVLDEGVEPGAIRVHARSEETSESRSEQLGDEAGVSLSRLAAGPFLLAAIAEDEYVELWNARVLVPPHDELVLAPVDLRGRLRTLEVLLTRSDGVPLRGSLRWRPAGADAFGERKRADERGRVVVTTSAGSIDLEAAASGHRTRRITGVSTASTVVLDTVVLEDGPLVTILVDGAWLLRDGERLSVRLEQPEALGWTMIEGERGEVRVQEPGSYAVTVFLHAAPTEGERRRGIELEDLAGRVEVDEGPDGAVFRCTLSSALLERVRR